MDIKYKLVTMEKKPSISRSFLINMCVVAIVSIGLLVGLWTWAEYADFREESEALRSRLLEDYKDSIRNEVQKAVDYIEYMKSQTEKRLRSSIKERVYEAHAIASHIYEINHGKKSPEEIQSLIREALRPIRFNQGRGYYFATNLNGIEELFADRPEMEGRDMLPVRGGQGEYVVRDMIELVKQKGEGFYQYTWSKPNVEGRNFPKIAFVKLFEPYNWFFGTGEYLDDVEKEIQEEVLSRISTIRFANEGYIFVGQWDGLSLAEPGKGKNMLHATDVNGVKIVQELIRRAQSGGGFVNYVLPKFPGLKPDPKISYAKGIENWEWYVGAGVYIDDIETAIEEKRAAVTRGIIVNVLKIFFILVGLMLFVYWAARRTARKTEASYSLFNSFFDRAARESAAIDPEAMNYEEFENLAHSANQMVEARKEAEDALRRSEEKYRLIVENQNDLVVKFNRDRQLLFISPSFGDMFGISENELIGHDFISLIHEDDRGAVMESLDRLNTPPYTFFHEERALTKNGWRWLAWSNRAILDTDGQPVEYIAVGRDITEMKQAEAELRESREWLRSVLDSIQAGVIVIDTGTHEILDVNRAATEMIGTEKEQLVGHKCHKYICPAQEGNCPVTDLGQRADQSERILLRAEGKEIPILKTASMANINRKQYLIESFLDITETKQLEARLQQSQKMEAVGTLAGGIAHDFNNILSAIVGYTQLTLLDMHESMPAYKNLQQALHAANRAKDLVAQILTFSRQTEKQHHPVQIGPIIRESLKFLRASLPTTIEIRQDIRKTTGSVLANPTQIYQVMINLTTNAAQAMRETGGVIETGLSEVTIEAGENDSELQPGRYVHLVVSDTGPGMDKEIQTRIFEPYFTTKKTGEGTGMGLAVVHGIVRSHGGYIRVHSQPGEGTAFHLYLPISTDTARPEQDLKPELLRGSGRILYVDDEETLVDLGRQMLETLGYSVDALTDSREALRVFQKQSESYDLVITDQTMPKMTGAELAQEILRLKPDLPIILCTGYSESISAEQAESLGIRAFLMKPLILQDLAVAIHSILDET